MREKLILAPGIKGSELIKNIALHGTNCINMKILSAGELARLALMKSGVAITQDFLSSKEECTLIAKAVAGESYFGKMTYSDIKELSGAVKKLRSLAVDGNEEDIIKDNLSKAIFTEKNEAIFSVYQKYMKLLSSENALDGISLIRKATLESKELDADVVTLKEYTLSPVEEALIKKISGGNYATISISDLFGVGIKPLSISSYKNSYGSPNEVETIINDIYKNKKADKCTVAVTDPSTYGQLFFDYALLYDIPVTFGCGIPIINSNPARLLVMYYHWITDGFFSGESLLRMISSKAFNKKRLYEELSEKVEGFSYSKFFDVLMGLRLTNDKATNTARIEAFKNAVDEEETIILSMLSSQKDLDAAKEGSKDYKDICKKKLCIPYIEKMAEELALSEEEFISKYALIRKGTNTNAEKLIMQLDMTSASAIFDELTIIRKAGIEQDTDDIILNVLKLSVCSQSSVEGSLHVTNLDGAVSTLRDNLYIAGLSATKFPGSPSENYLVLDDDLKQFGSVADIMTSEGKIKRKKESLSTLVHLASNLGSTIMISYSGMNVSELKKDNASSVIFELFKEQSGKNVSSKELENEIENIKYFEPAISATRDIGNAINIGDKIKNTPVTPPDDFTIDPWTDREWSPSAINSFLDCPRKFLLCNIMGIPEPQDENPFEVISPMAIGTMAHSLMERLANSTISRDDFITLSGEYFDRYMSVNPTLIEANIEGAKAEFLEMMEIAFDTDPHREVVLAEQDIHCTHTSGVKIHGFPDRVEKLDDGTYLIVDFKSGRNINHEEDDINSCLQVVIYAYLLEQQGFKVTGGEFRYIRLGETITCKYDDEMKKALSDMLEYFKTSVSSFDFPYLEPTEDNEDPCKYCRFKHICNK